MPDLLFFALAVSGLVAVYGVLKWAAKMEARAQARQAMSRVYYLRRGRKGESPGTKRRPEPDEMDDDGFT